MEKREQLKKVLDLLKGLSSCELKKVSLKAKELSESLKNHEPNYELAILHGVRDESYNTTANGGISSYSGRSDEITMEDGSKWIAVGHRSTGDAYYAYSGFIEFFPQ